MKRASIHVGTCGFSYRDWLGSFYPQFCPEADFLRCYALRFSSVELYSTFYRIPTKEQVRQWDKVTPDQFRFAARFPRGVTHEGDLESRVNDVARFLRAISPLGGKLGPLLLQFPGSFKPDRADMLMAILDAVPHRYTVSVEFRCGEWLTDEILSEFASRKVGVCFTESPNVPKVARRTSSHVYMRLVGDCSAITEDFSYVRNDRWDELQEWEDLAVNCAADNAEVFVFFSNHYSGHAPSTALDFREKLDRRLVRVS